MVRIFTVERGLFVGGWGDHDSVRDLGVCEHSDLTLEDIVKDAPSFFGRHSQKVCRVVSTVISGSFVTRQRRTLECVSGGTPSQTGGVQFHSVNQTETEPRVVHATLSFDNGLAPCVKPPGCAPHRYTIEDPDPNATGGNRYHARRTTSLLCSERWALEAPWTAYGSAPSDPSAAASWTWVEGYHANPDGNGWEKDSPTGAWVLFALQDPSGAVAAKVWVLPAIKSGVYSRSTLGSGYYAIEIGAGDSYGARTEANLLPRALLFSLAALHSYEYDRRTWQVGN